MRVSSKADYAVRAVLELAAAGEPLNSETIAERQSIPPPFLKKILGELQRGRVVVSSRVREVLEQVTLAGLVEDRLPEPIATLASRPDSWVTR